MNDGKLKMKLTHLLIALGFMAGCTVPTTPTQTNPTQDDVLSNRNKQTIQLSSPPETGQPALHAIHDQQLDEVMLQINALVFGQMRNELDLSHEKKLHANKIAQTAHELLKNVDILREVMPRLNLLPNEKITFLALANKLKSESAQIEEDAKHDDLKNIPSRLQQIMETCTSCHSLFRDNRNLLDRCRDPKSTC